MFWLAGYLWTRNEDCSWWLCMFVRCCHSHEYNTQTGILISSNKKAIAFWIKMISHVQGYKRILNRGEAETLLREELHPPGWPFPVSTLPLNDLDTFHWCLFLFFQLGGEAGVSNPQMQSMKAFFRVMCIIMIPLTAQFPTVSIQRSLT